MPDNETAGTVPQRNRALEALVIITGLLLIFGIILALVGSLLIGIIVIGMGLFMGVITLVTKAIVSGQQR